MATPRYGDLIRLGPDDSEVMEVLKRVPLGAGVSQGSVSEAALQKLLFRFPETLPIAAIDATYAGAVPICQELRTPAGFVDALYVNPLGQITLTEFKLWRNPQSRREVIGQILDYAKELAAWSYEDLQRQVSIALNESGNILYSLVDAHSPGIDEAEFVDNVTRHLRRGEFLLLIVGDGIQEGVANIVDFVQRHSGLHFNLALVEVALYRDAANHLIVQPRPGPDRGCATFRRRRRVCQRNHGRRCRNPGGCPFGPGGGKPAVLESCGSELLVRGPDCSRAFSQQGIHHVCASAGFRVRGLGPVFRWLPATKRLPYRLLSDGSEGPVASRPDFR